MCRGNNKQNIFNNDSDKLYYWRLLHELKNENCVDIFHYCMMDNHVHLIVWISNESKVSKFMKQLSLSYYNYYKKRYGYWGHIWQGRYKSNIIEADSHLLHCGKYIELNPVRAGMVNLPDEYAFSSYRHYALGYPDAVISDSPAFIDLAEDCDKRKQRYIAFVVDNNIINSDKIATQAFIGNKDFIEKLRQYYGIKEAISKGGRPRKAGCIKP
jgi:putative transposase